MHELKLASHVRGAGRGEIGNDAARVVPDEVRRWPGIPVGGAPPSVMPTVPEGRDAIDRRILRHLEELSAINGAVGDGCAHGAGYSIGALPAKCGRTPAGRRGSGAGAHGSAAGENGDN